jgi:hypothetical protein
MNAATEELLISRAVDGAASPEDWRALEALAARDPEVWPRLLAALQAEQALRSEVAASLAAADAVELPGTDAAGLVDPDAPASPPAGIGAAPAGRLRRFRLPTWTGWAAAAALALAWAGLGGAFAARAGRGGEDGLAAGSTRERPDPGAAAAPDSPLAARGPEAEPGAGVRPFAEGDRLRPVDEAEISGLRTGAYGDVLADFPAVLVGSRPAPDGSGHELYYLRQWLERARVQPGQLYEVNHNDLGQRVAVPVTGPPPGARPPL